MGAALYSCSSYYVYLRRCVSSVFMLRMCRIMCGAVCVVIRVCAIRRSMIRILRIMSIRRRIMCSMIRLLIYIRMCVLADVCGGKRPLSQDCLRAYKRLTVSLAAASVVGDSLGLDIFEIPET